MRVVLIHRIPALSNQAPILSPLSLISISSRSCLCRHFSQQSNPQDQSEAINEQERSIAAHNALVERLIKEKTRQFSLENKSLNSEEGLHNYWNSAIEVMRDRQWTETSRRAGLIGQKMGMMHVWDHWGVLTPLTVVRCENTVVRVDSTLMTSKEGIEYVSMVLGMGDIRPWKVNKPTLTQFIRAGVAPLRKMRAFTVTPDAVLPVGWKLDVRHFKPGQRVDIQGTTINKGFQGPMKRWGFAGLRASHGVSISHRSHGSVGSAGKGRIFKGKKMAGRMGGKRRTLKRVLVYKVDIPRNLIFLKGSVHGPRGGWLRLIDARYGPKDWDNMPPFPTFLPQPGDEAVKEVYAPPDKAGDPFTEAEGLKESPNANII